MRVAPVVYKQGFEIRIRKVMIMILKNFLKNNPFSNGIFFRKAKKEAMIYLSEKDKWADIQLLRLAGILSYAKDHSKYYSKFLEGKTITVHNAENILRQMPLLTKDIVREQQYSIFSDEIGDDWKIWGNTGGSTGEPLKFPRLSFGQWNEPVCQYLTYYYLAGDKDVRYGDVIVSVSGERVPEESQKEHVFYLKAGNFPWGKYRFSTLYMTEENMKYYVESINQIKPSFIRAYSAGALTLAQYIQRNQLKLKFQLKGIYLTSESFSEQSRQFISDVFKCPVVGQYGHTEMSVFAIQHKDDSVYECVPLYGYTEILDEQGQHVKEGETGEIVVTGFNQIGLPFIRYKTGDLATYKGCKNGIVYIDAIQGRTVDYLVDREGKKVFLTGAIFGGHIKAFNHIAQWQLHQKERGKVAADIIKGAGYDKEIEDELIQFFEKFNIEVALNYVSYIHKQANGKQKFLIQEIR